jgi:hypothetical protein
MNAMCTGCVIEGYNPITTSFPEGNNDLWTSTVVTATVVTEFTTYNDTVVTNTATLNKTMTVVNPEKQTITHTTPVFLVTPKPGTYLTLEAGPTYVIFNTLFGGVERYISTYFAFITSTYETCEATPSKLNNWQPTRTEDWSYFIETHATFTETTVMNYPLPLPTAALQHLQSNLAILSQFHGQDIMSCTVAPTNGGIALPKPSATELPQPAAPTYGSISTQTFLSTTYETTSKHSTVVGCLRIGCGAKPTQDPPYSDQSHDQPSVKEPDVPTMPTDTPNKPNDPTDPNDTNTSNNDGKGNGQPNDQPNGQSNNQADDQRPPGNPVTIGDGVFTVRPGQPTLKPDSPNNQDQPPPVVIIGTETLTRGQTTVINGVPVVVPSDGGGTQLVVGGTTIAVNNGPTAAPVLTVGRNPVTANPQGQFVVGTETLKPGGPAVTIDGSTLSLGSGGTIAIVNGVTQTLANVPLITSPPVITIGDRTVSATVIGGTTQLVLNGHTLAPGSAITVDGTAYSLPASGPASILLVNGATSTLSPNRLATPTVRDGTTAFIFGPDQTLTPGGVLTISGTTLSMPLSHSGSVVVINGVTSTLANPQITAAPPLTMNGNTYTATVRDGTTEYVIASGTTLRPGEALTLSGTTYSLDPKGTALVVNGQTSSIARTPATNSASTTKSRNVGDFVWSGIGGGGGGGNAETGTSKGGGNALVRRGVDGWVERVVMGLAGWVLLVV